MLKMQTTFTCHAERSATELARERESKHLVVPMREHHYYVYMMVSSSRRALYTGVTNNLERRVFQYKNDEFEGFSQQYQAHRLVWFERYSNIQTAIARAKQLKGWRRAKKNWLVQMTNPEWRDLSADWGKPVQLLTPR